MCTIVRNDLHLREFLVRNLLLGISHVVVLDNNQRGSDYNITMLLQPFVQAGLVTHEPFEQDSGQRYLTMEVKNPKTLQCLQEYGQHVDWVMALDTDEVLYITSSAPPSATANESAAAAAAGGMVERSVDDARFKSALPQYRVHLIHYYGKTVEEYIVKSEQSQPPYFRQLPDAYDKARSCSLEPVQYDTQYTMATRGLIQQLRAAQAGMGDGGLQQGGPPEAKPMSRSDYHLYLFFKLRVAHKDEWDEAKYLEHNPAVAAHVVEGRYVDGLHHFMVEGFAKGNVLCWWRQQELPASSSQQLLDVGQQQRTFCL
ncbi:hypothetical protein OEZ86_010148 [Tetradesmus obliquus]|nr:hypothetical protein OEZ86_010148 [Tetradesmus obliquus]